MALLVTILLMLIGFSTDVAASSPSINAVSALDVWMLSMQVKFIHLMYYSEAS